MIIFAATSESWDCCRNFCKTNGLRAADLETPRKGNKELAKPRGHF
jgi:hypothetical protein